MVLAAEMSSTTRIGPLGRLRRGSRRPGAALRAVRTPASDGAPTDGDGDGDGVGPVVLVTGASGGIGREVCLAYADRRARLTLLGRSRDLLESLAGEVERRGGTAAVAVVDVTDHRAVDAAVREILERHGRLDVVINSAAVVAYGRLEDVPPAAWERAVQVNVLGSCNVARAALRAFRDGGGGTLVLVGSLLGQITTPYMGAYVISKWAVEGLARVLQQESRDLAGVHVSIVHPGAVDTPIYALAGTWAGRRGEPPPPVSSPQAAARAVLRAADEHRRQTRVGFANPLMRLGFATVPMVFDVLVGPLMRRLGFGPRTGAEEGNLFRPSQDVAGRLAPERLDPRRVGSPWPGAERAAPQAPTPP